MTPPQGQEPARTQGARGSSLLFALVALAIGCKTAQASAPVCATLNDCERSCAAENGADCFALGFRYANGDGVAQDRAVAMEFFDRACDLGSGVACLNAGIDVQEGVGAPRNTHEAAEFFRRGCDLSDGRACNYLAVAYAKGDGVEQDWDEALSLLGRACDLGSPTACGNLGTEYRDGGHVRPDPSKATALLQKGCEIPSGAAYFPCLAVAESYREGRGVKADPARARAFEVKANQRLEAGCSEGLPAACLEWAKNIEQGVGADPDAAKVQGLRDRACDLSRKRACPSPGRACEVDLPECKR